MMKITSSLIKPISQIPSSKSKSLPTTPVSVWLSESSPSSTSTSTNTIISEIETILKTTPSIIETPLERLVPRISASTVASFLQQQQHREDTQAAFRFFAWAMRRMRFNSWVSHNSMIRILQVQGENGFKAAWKVLQELKGGGIPIVPHVFAVLIQAYAKSGRAVNAIESFGKMHEYKCRPNTFVYNTVLHILMEEKASHVAMAVYYQMIKCHCPPNRPTFNILIHGLCKLGMIEDALPLLVEMTNKRGISPNTMIVTCFAKENNDAHKFLHSISMKEGNCYPDTITYNALLSRFCKSGQIHEALRLLKSFQTEGGYVIGLNGYSCLIDGLFRAGRFEEACQRYRNMLEENISPDCILYTIMIKGCLKAGKVKDAFAFLGEMIKQGLVPDTFCYNTLIKGLCDVGLLDKAESFKLKLKISKQKGFPDSATQTIMICGHCKEGLVQKAQEIFDGMEKQGCFPTVMTFNALINGLCRAGELKKAVELFFKMQEERRPSVFLELAQDKVHDSASLQNHIDQLCDSGRVLKAYKLIKKLVDSGVAPDVITYNILINGCGKVRLEDSSDQMDSYIEDKLFKDMKQKRYSPDAVTYRALMTAAFRKGRFLEGLRLCLEFILQKYISQKDILQKADIITAEEIDKALKKVQEHFERGDIEAVVRGNIKAVVRGLLEIDLKLKDVDPAPYTICLIALCRAERVDDAYKIFLVLTEFDINVTPPSCVALITGLCRTREVALALDIFQYSMRRGFFLMPQICNMLIKCLCTKHKKKDALELVRRMKAMGYDLDL